MDFDNKLYGRAIVEVQNTSIQITIPVKKKDWVQTAASIIILCFFIVVESSALYFRATAFYLLFPIPAILLSILVLRSLIWELGGKEIIIIDQANIYIEKKNRLFNKPKVYDIGNVRYIQLHDDSMIYMWGSGYIENHRAYDTGGIICFKYGNKVVRFGTDLSEKEAANIVALLKERNFLRNGNLGKSKYTIWWKTKGDAD